MKKILVLISVLLLIIVVAESLFIFANIDKLFPQVVSPQPVPKPLLSYTFQNLKKTKFPMTDITFGKIVSQNQDSVQRAFYYETPEKPNSKVMLKVSGLANIPKASGNYPVIVMFRGFIPQDAYQPGADTQPSALELVKAGYITLAPDFLGFGESASGSADAFENRFQTYTTALSLLSSLPTLNKGLNSIYSGSVTANLQKIGIWGHSNGGHIALSVLAISGVTYPTVLWAPVSTSFPYSILYYTDESDDQGKALRKILAGFEKIYNTDLFSPSNYYNWIKAPVEVDQGLSDQEVPFWWSDNLVTTLKKEGLSVTYITYPNADHNMLPSGWSQAVANTISFYNNEFSK